MSNTGWIGVDLDATLAYYDGWKGINHIGPPIPLMLQRVKDWLAQGRTVKIFTARVSSNVEDENTSVRHYINLWCDEHIGQRLEITNKKDFAMVALWDDRCVTVEENTGVKLTRFKNEPD